MMKWSESLMPTSNPVEIMLAHDHWATRNIIETCAALTPEQFHHRFDMGPGSLHDTTTHILAAMRVWGDVLASREQRPRLEGSKRSTTELLALLDELSAISWPAADVSARRDGHAATS